MNEEAVFYCRECGEVAATVSLGTTPRELVTFFMGRVRQWLTEEQIEAVGQVLATRNPDAIYQLLYEIDPERVAFHCSECNANYCIKHWNAQMQFDDDPEWRGWYDCTYGTCPQGHRHLL